MVAASNGAAELSIGDGLHHRAHGEHGLGQHGGTGQGAAIRQGDGSGEDVAYSRVLPQADAQGHAVEGFGPAAERLTTQDGTVHLLYPEQGVVIALDPQERAKPVLQYVAPSAFDRLRAPLKR